ncbi:hypothetical protein I6N90_21080 [Paenibacillus sp. GSMTC-2017]|uniref:macrolide family glycosyltransferase n=1 Tax=Paenibacillus sp. GSMTC-2017 TaxID=2794350 RepID=UPI0018D79689|nr:macrolide family glycosyltransferase [Paenibacillus sp. GSMTC-2017]MBH5320288.1 hypothetical protein [Paenibacillus sp. GSMTC-2017]
MSKLIYFGIDLHGHINVSLGLIRALVEKGEEVLYYSSEPFREKIEATGAQFRSYGDMGGFEMREGDRVDTFLLFSHYILDKSRELVERFRDEVIAWKPDYIIHDAFAYWGKEFAQLLGVPGISAFATFAYIDEMANYDPDFFMSNIIRIEDDSVYKNYNSADLYRRLVDMSSKTIATKYGLNKVNVINDILGSKEKLNILYSSKSFYLFPDSFDDSYLFAGYSITPRNETVEFPFELLDGRPLIYISFGTILNELEDLFLNCFEAFGQSDVQVVMSVGYHLRVEDLKGIPDNFIVRNYVPQLDILERATVFINHAGTNSVYESICFEVPQVVIPQAFDEFMGAVMIERAGIGVYIRNMVPSAEELREAVQQVLSDSTFRNRSTSIKASFQPLDHAINEIAAYVERERGATIAASQSS